MQSPCIACARMHLPIRRFGQHMATRRNEPGAVKRKVARELHRGRLFSGRFRVLPLQQWAVWRACLHGLKAAFDPPGIEIPFPQPSVHTPAGSGMAPTAPAPG